MVQSFRAVAVVLAATLAAGPMVARAFPPAHAAHASVAVDLSDDGLQFVTIGNGHTSTLAFGSPTAQVVTALTQLLARPSHQDTNANCGAGPTQETRWSNGLTVLSQHGQFLGWEIDRPGLTTMDGIGVGISRVHLGSRSPLRIQHTTLGTEFSFGTDQPGLGGLLSSPARTGRIMRLWAGLTCHFS